jgi:3-oxoisoapionate kinase
MSAASNRDLLLSFYGDDFSGSTDVMEACVRNGIPTVLFLGTPSDRQVAEFPDARVIGIAGVSRSQTPEWMSEHLPPVFHRLEQLQARITHYKVCSTFDSSPEIGSIGRALDIGHDILGGPWVPLVVGAPILRRYTLFGNLFATVDGTAYRLDRHPTMSRHPVTPMHESDLRAHLGQQTQKRIGLVDILALQSEDPDRRLRDALQMGSEVVLFDVLDEASLRQVGKLVWKHAVTQPLFAVGSSGLEYALAEWWRESGDVPIQNATFKAQPSDRIAVVSGSCSPVTESQIRWAVANGFQAFPLDARCLAANDGQAEASIDAAAQKAESALALGRSVVLYTALGPSGPMLLDAGANKVDTGRLIGSRLGDVLKRVLKHTGVRRAVIAGGDTSGHASQQLNLFAVEMLRPLAPGSPLCKAYCDTPEFDGLEVVFKGGQVGGEQFFGQVLDA